MNEFPKSIKGKRIELRTLEPTFDNASMLFACIEASREHILSGGLEWALLEAGPEDSFRFLEGARKNREEKTKYNFGIFDEHGIFCGTISLFDISETARSGEIGYWLAKEAAGKGIMSEAVGLIEAEAFAGGFNRLVIKCKLENTASAGVARRCGYLHEGTLRQARFDKTVNRLVDTLVFSKLKSDREESRQSSSPPPLKPLRTFKWREARNGEP